MRGPELSRRALLTLAAAGASAVAFAPAARAEKVLLVEVGGTPEAVAVNSVTGFAYVSDPSTGTIVVLDSRSGTVADVIPVGGEPAGLAVDTVTNRVFVANPPAGTVLVLDGRANEVLSVVPAGPGASTVDVDEQANRIYAASALTGTLAVIDGVGCRLLDLVPGPTRGLSSTAVDSGRKLAYCTSTGTDSLEVFDIGAGRFTGGIPVGKSPTGVAVHSASGTVFVANSAIHHLSIVDTGARKEKATVLLRSESSALAVHEGSNTVYANGGPNGLARIDGRTNLLTGDLSLGVNPGAVAIDQRTRTVYVADPLRGRVSLIRDF
ncbi:YncE family protein [Amycolatopsis roodepoortensis]|uniref:YVTN family beta-propeller protein n=1 Tax=Amycolatopsis roodepoortensis TaxID=700274 RepID=A0ABR9LLC4_9PSEU|nr:YncE family protein [Amycolatopsis roodepoortensis]MBE1581453.1 YVTN family beta-propeller protein [Amycolatopsis roodepoortensis]